MKPAKIKAMEPDMATAPELILAPETGTDIVLAVTADPGIVLIDRVKYSAWYESRLAEGSALSTDVTVKKNRDALRKFAADTRSDKAGIKKARLRLTEEWRTMTNQANAAGKEIDEELEQLAVTIRKPLTDWEEAEEARVAACRAVIDGFRNSAQVSIDDTADGVRARGSSVYNTALDADRFGEMLPEAQAAKDAAIATLRTALARLTKEEADRAELEKLRGEAAERARVDAEKAAEAEAERQRVEAERLAGERRIAAERAAEEQRLAAEKAEADRIAAAEKAAAERAQQEAEAAAQAERDRVQREHEAELAAERAKAAEAERVAQAERDRVAELDRQREAKEAEDAAAAKKLADEKAERETSAANRARVKTAAKQAIMTCGASEETAQKIVLAIIAREIPGVTLEF